MTTADELYPEGYNVVQSNDGKPDLIVPLRDCDIMEQLSNRDWFNAAQMISAESLLIYRSVCGCKTLIQLRSAERLCSFTGRDFSAVVEAKRLQLDNSSVNKAMNDRLNKLAKL